MRPLTLTAIFIVSTTLLLATVFSAAAAEKDPCAPRVPAGELAQYKAMKPPVADSPESIQKGKEIFNGKGSCAGCHGNEGKGDGPLAASLNPSPRNFTDPKFDQCKSAGEMFWAVKNGISGTGMLSAVGSGLITEEEAWQAVLYERSLGKK
ncbi:MAG: cytochrome c [Nitrospirae bacterium]|nr:cytochrome c [Candidatus Manganitrophaceae bacterium]